MLPSNQKRRGGRGGHQKAGVAAAPAYYNAGKGLLETPYISPWQQGYGYEEIQTVNFQRYMKGVQKAEQVRSNLRKIQPPTASSVSASTSAAAPHHQLYNASRTGTNTATTPLRQNHHYQQQHHPHRYAAGHYAHGSISSTKPESYTKNMWLGKGRGQQQQHSPMNKFQSHNTPTSTPSTTRYPTPIGGRTAHQSATAGRGQWMNIIE